MAFSVLMKVAEKVKDEARDNTVFFLQRTTKPPHLTI